jgi:hypothetical protein
MTKQYTEVNFVGAKIISAGYNYGQLVELKLEHPDGKQERIFFGVAAAKFDEIKRRY